MSELSESDYYYFLQLTDFYRKMRYFKKTLKGDVGLIFTKNPAEKHR
jgi:hypothetical protein